MINLVVGGQEFSQRLKIKYKGACPCGGIGRRVGLKIQSGFTLGASSSLAKGIFQKTHSIVGLFCC